MTVSEHRLGEHKLPTVGALRHLVKFSDFLSRLLLLSIKNSWQHLSSPSAMQACLAGVHSNLDTPALPTECEISKVQLRSCPAPLPEQAIWKCCDADVEISLFQFHQNISSSFSNFPTAVLHINGNMCTCGLLTNHICAVSSFISSLICALYCHF